MAVSEVEEDGMLHTGYLLPERGRRHRASALSRLLTAVAAIVATAATLAGCSTARAAAGPAIQVAAAYVPVPKAGDTVAFVVIRNNGGTDSLVSARTNVGGQVTFHAPDPPGVVTRHTVPAIPIPGHGMLAMAPDGFYMVITGVDRQLHGGKDIILTLNFAHAGPVRVVAQITNPETGGASYFLN